jgi:hypothetical protein
MMLPNWEQDNFVEGLMKCVPMSVSCGKAGQP